MQIIVIFSCDHSMNRGLMCTVMCVLLEGVDKTVNKRPTLVAMERKKGTGIRNNIKVSRNENRNTVYCLE